MFFFYFVLQSRLIETPQLSRRLTATARPQCSPAHRVIFLKTHKTAGTSIATIIQRYGYTRNLTFAIPNRNTPVFNVNSHFKRTEVLGYHKIARNKSFDMLTSHAVYLRPEMDATVPNALYVTSLRDSVDQFESAFVYYDIKKQLRFAKEENPIATFFTNPTYYKKKVRYGRTQVQNGQLYDLGFDTRFVSDPYYVQYKIRQLDGEFDLVLIKEYFDESLILMKKLFCWELDDIIYIPKRTRAENSYFNNSESLHEKIRKWNHADMLLYEHFNRTLWRKIAEYGDEFWTELEIFRRRVKEVTSVCESNIQVVKDKIHHIDVVKLRNGSKFCEDLVRMDGDYTTLIRCRMKTYDNTTIQEPVTKNATNKLQVMNRTNRQRTLNKNASVNSRVKPGNATGRPLQKQVVHVKHVKVKRPRSRPRARAKRNG